MNNLKTMYLFGLLVVSLLLWEAWQNDYVRPQQAADAAAVEEQAPNNELAENQAELPTLPSTTTLPDTPDSTSAVSSTSKVSVKTDVYEVELSTQGADIYQLALLKYPVSSDEPENPVDLLSDTSAKFFVTQSGLLAETDAPNHYAEYRTEQASYTLADGADELKVPFYWQGENGIQVVKTFTFKRDSYVVNVDYQITNQSGETYTTYPYAQLNRTAPTESSMMIHTYTGVVFSSPDNEYDKVSFGDLDDAPFSRDFTDGWAAMIQHYFVAAIVPDEDGAAKSFYAKTVKANQYTAGVKMPALTVPAGETATAHYEMFLGPKKVSRLEQVAENLPLTVDYGMFTIISEPLFWVMEWLYKFTGNWGWAIVLITLLIKLAFFRLSAASYRSMASMRKLAPKLAALKERYGDDKQKFNQEMMNLYRTEKINPLGGCLPILVQMPVFLAFYWVLVESIELRQADFILWIHDLTAMDPYFILPVLFGISMWFQQHLNPTPPDPAQAMMMKILPLIFTVFFAFFPSGLVLYWVVNNVLSIAQQWYITRKMDAL